MFLVVLVNGETQMVTIVEISSKTKTQIFTFKINHQLQLAPEQTTLSFSLVAIGLLIHQQEFCKSQPAHLGITMLEDFVTVLMMLFLELEASVDVSSFLLLKLLFLEISLQVLLVLLATMKVKRVTFCKFF